uniref:GPI transamidase component PIG-T n=1 Tax=Globodera rostochiensis TaxID=31243 RepID=A0A914GS51_GLORO
MSRHLIRLQICIVFCAFLSLSSSEQFSETLLITPLPNGDLFSLFNFTILTNSGTENSEPNALRHRPVLVPWLLQHLANQFGITDLHLSLAQGFWRARLWGAQLPEAEIPSGTELIAKFGAFRAQKTHNNSENDQFEQRNWSRLVHTINGLFCMSILQMVPQQSSNPKLALLKDSSRGERWFWGTLGGESVCTENIKAWKNLLPCKQKGLVSLMDPIQLLSAKFHALSLKLTKSEVDDHWHFSLLAQTVHDGETAKEEAKKGLFLLQSLFGRKLVTECPIVSKSRIIIAQNELFGLKTSNTSSDNGSQKFVDFDGKQSNKIGTFRVEKPNFHALQRNLNSILLHSHIKSVNQIGGRISTQITNPWPMPLTNAVYAHQIPWHLRIFLHTLEVQCRSFNGTGTQKTKFELAAFTLARDRGRPLLMELRMDIPAMSKCTVDVDYEAAFLRIADFPPDASSGIFVPGALLQIPVATNSILTETLPFLLDIHKNHRVRVFGEPLLVLLPIPDFSMPFNVICLVCTAIAIYYGNAIALCTKIMVPIPKKKPGETGTVAAAQPGFFGSMRSRISTKFSGISQRIGYIFRRRPKDEKQE